MHDVLVHILHPYATPKLSIDGLVHVLLADYYTATRGKKYKRF